LRLPARLNALRSTAPRARKVRPEPPAPFTKIGLAMVIEPLAFSWSVFWKVPPPEPEVTMLPELVRETGPEATLPAATFSEAFSTIVTVPERNWIAPRDAVELPMLTLEPALVVVSKRTLPETVKVPGLSLIVPVPLVFFRVREPPMLELPFRIVVALASWIETLPTVVMRMFLLVAPPKLLLVVPVLRVMPAAEAVSVVLPPTVKPSVPVWMIAPL